MSKDFKPSLYKSCGYFYLSLGDSNPKLAKAVEGFRPYVVNLSLAPSDLAIPGRTTCGAETLGPGGCRDGCLGAVTGRGNHPKVRAARIRKTKELFADRRGFVKRLEIDLVRAEKYGMRSEWDGVVARLNTFSDRPWENYIDMEAFRLTQFFDYTKLIGRMRKFIAGHMPKNYDLTFSHAGPSNVDDCRSVLDAGGNVAVVFDDQQPMPDAFWGHRVHDATRHDFRFLDPRGIAGLQFKTSKAFKGAGDRSRRLAIASGFIANAA